MYDPGSNNWESATRTISQLPTGYEGPYVPDGPYTFNDKHLGYASGLYGGAQSLDYSTTNATQVRTFV